MYAILGALLIGISKAGVKGTGNFVVALMALAFGSKVSTGIVLPLLIFGDVMAVAYYKSNINWNHLKKFLPPMIIGVVMGAYFGKDLQDVFFSKAMAILILSSVIMMMFQDKFNVYKIDEKKSFTLFFGWASGFSTMIGNLAGAFANIYFLAHKMPKLDLIATAAWLFLIINIFKLPFHIFFWHTIDGCTLTQDLKFLPLVIIGFWLGLKVVKVFSESFFRQLILVLTAISAMVMLFK